MTTREAELLEQVIVAELPRWIAAHPQLRAQLQDVLSGVAPDAPLRMTYPEFLAWADEDTLAEWVAVPDTDQGEVMMTSPASNKHQDISGFLENILRSFVETHRLGVVRSAPFQMKLERSGREPDLLFVATAHLDRLKETHLDGPADLVVEIVSPESAGRDRGEKFYEYAQGGVAEYWLIDPQTRWADFYRLDEGGRYRAAFSGEEGEYHSAALPGFWLRVEWLWQEPLPHPLRVLGEIGGVDTALVEQFLQALGEKG
ncbi:MAG TPA: Uma2 family endonuclease [Chloroflexi bacterium]|nr:Uma2 family endonuclease [Chloroflexota bacterium]